MIGTKKYFETHAKHWVLNAYHDDGYNYPVAFHRARIVSKFISGVSRKKLRILDLGCGGGDITFLLAQEGHTVLGVDQSQEMISLAEGRKAKLPKTIQRRIKFIHTAVDKVLVEEKKFDVVVAMGLIGYLPSDAYLFNLAHAYLKSDGYFLVSCRNRLFNMDSISFRTKNEVKSGAAVELMNEIEQLYTRISTKDADAFIKRLKNVAKDLPWKTSFDKKFMLSPAEKYVPETSAVDIEPRQSTPKQVKGTAAKCGFKHAAYYGVHPHFLDPNTNKLFPPQIFNKISSSLEELEHLPISLVWSSVFIGAFKKSTRKIKDFK